MQFKRILIIKPSSMGDIIQANPVLTALKKEYPGSYISWLVFDSWSELLSMFPDVNDIIVWKRKGGIREFLRVLKAVRKEKFDLIIDLQGLMRTGILACFSDAKEKIGVPGMKEFSWLLIKEVFSESKKLNAVRRCLETVRYFTGSNITPEFKISIPAQDEVYAKSIVLSYIKDSSVKLIGIVPTARGDAKQWPPEYFKELIKLINFKYKNIKFIIFGTEKDKGIIQHEEAVDLCGQTNLKQLAAVFKMCSIVIGGDTGTVHMAAALDIPTIVIFGGSDINETAPVSKNAVTVSKYMQCSPCRGRPKCNDYKCLTSIQPQEVFETLEKLNSKYNLLS